MNSRNETYVLEFLIKFFNLKYGKNDDDRFKARKNKHFDISEDSGKSLLLVLDNCQHLLDKDTEKFKSFQIKLTSECEHIHILIVTRHAMEVF